MNYILKIVKALENSNILFKGITKKIKNKTKKQKRGFLEMLLGTLEVSLLRNMLSGKGIVRAGTGNKDRNGVLRANYGKKISVSSFNKN